MAGNHDRDMGELLLGHSHASEARHVVLYLTATFCRGRYSLSDVVDKLANLTGGSLCASDRRIAGWVKC